MKPTLPRTTQSAACTIQYPGVVPGLRARRRMQEFLRRLLLPTGTYCSGHPSDRSYISSVEPHKYHGWHPVTNCYGLRVWHDCDSEQTASPALRPRPVRFLPSRIREGNEHVVQPVLATIILKSWIWPSRVEQARCPTPKSFRRRCSWSGAARSWRHTPLWP